MWPVCFPFNRKYHDGTNVLFSSRYSTFRNQPAIIVNRLTYALPAWTGFLTADLTSKLNSLLKKCFKYGYSKQCNKLSQLIEHADDKLLASLNKPEHCADYLSPSIEPSVRSQQSRGTLPICIYSENRNSLVCLFLYHKASSKPKQNVHYLA